MTSPRTRTTYDDTSLALTARRTAGVLLLALITALPMVSFGQDPSGQDEGGQDASTDIVGNLRVDIEPETITVGDRASITVELAWPAGAPDVDPRFPAWQETWGKAELLEIGPVTRERAPGGDTIFRQTITATAFDVGDTRLPPMAVALPIGERTQELKTPSDLVLVVASVLPEDAEADAEPLPPAAAEGLPIGQRFIWSTALLAILCTAAGWRALRARPSLAYAGAAARPTLPPLDELKQRLRGVDAEHAVRTHTVLSMALRGFLGRSTGVPAVERTTTEIRRLLRTSTLDPDLSRRFATLLMRCDEVKFVAGAATDVATTGERLRAAEALAEDIDRSLRHDAAESDAGEAGTSTPKAAA